MFRMLGAAVAAVALSCAGAAGAAVLWTGTVGSDTTWASTSITEPRGGTYEFRTTGKFSAAYAFAQMNYRSYGGTLDGAQWWGSSNFSTVPLPDTVPAQIFTPLADGFRIQFYTPPSLEIVSPTGCYLDPEHCGYYHYYDYLGVLGIDVLFEAGQEGATWTLTRISSAAVPEPEAWLLLIAGFGLVGFALRRRYAGKLVSPA